MNMDSFDYHTFFDDMESLETLSNNTTSPTTTENDSDSGIAYTPPMNTTMDNTVIDLDNWPLHMDSPLSDDQDEYKRFLALLDEKSSLILDDNSTFEGLFSEFDQSEQETLQQIPSVELPTLSPTPSNIHEIKQCIKLQSYPNTTSNGVQRIRFEPLNNKPNITIVQSSKPITFTNVSIAKMPVVTSNSVFAPLAKRRRSDSPTTEVPTLTLNQLKLQYGNLSDEGLKKQLRMIKNRESASLSRQRRKELMENLDIKNKELTDENEQLKREKSKLLTRIHTLELENEILKKYKLGSGIMAPQARKPLILMGIALLVVFNVFTLKSLAPASNDPSNSIDLYNGAGTVVRGRTILSDRRIGDDNSYLNSNEQDYGPNGNNKPAYPYIQCVAYINKTHSQRINQDLHSWVQDQYAKEEINNLKPVIIPDPKSLVISSTSVIPTGDSSLESQQHISRKVARHNQRQIKAQTENENQLQPYTTYEANYDDFIHTLDRKNDTLYFVSFKRDHLILPAKVQNQTQRPKMSLILPASMANLNKSIHVPPNHVPMIKIDCEVEDTKLVFVKRTHIPSLYQNDLLRYYSSIPEATI